MRTCPHEVRHAQPERDPFDLPRLLPGQRPRGGSKLAARAPERPDADVRELGHGPVQDLFTGVETRDYTRATTSQKCVRAGGKHNDLDNVGYTARHHTFFEMLGNFSFGDYFKEQAIVYAWDLITKGYDIDADRLLVTVYHTDEEAAAFWRKVAGLPDDRIIRITTDDNFWTMGPTGPVRVQLRDLLRPWRPYPRRSSRLAG